MGPPKNPFEIFSLEARTRRVASTVNPQVPGSIPGRGAKYYKHIAQLTRLGFCFLGGG